MASKREAEKLLQVMQTLDENIRIPEFTIDESVHFLDVQLTVREREVSTALYQKPTHLKVLLHFQSAHSASLKKNIVLSQLIRCYRLSSDLVLAGTQMWQFVQLMKELRWLPKRTARQIWNKFEQWLKREQVKKVVVEDRAAVETRLRPATLWLTNNVYTRPMCKTIAAFKKLLSASDQLKVYDTRVCSLTAKSIGAQCFAV